VKVREESTISATHDHSSHLQYKFHFALSKKPKPKKKNPKEKNPKKYTITISHDLIDLIDLFYQNPFPYWSLKKLDLAF
jgi:hypothetical protein